MTALNHLLTHPGLLPLTIQSGNGCYVFDSEGKPYLDFVSGVGVNALGHNHPRINTAISEQAKLCLHTSNLYSHPYQAALATELCRISHLDRALFTNSGTEATEAALKLACQYAKAADSQKTHIVALEGSFHGRTRGALSITGQTRLREDFAPYCTDVTFVQPNDEAALRSAVTSRTAAVILESVLGEGGVYPLTRPFLRCARAATLANQALLIADECQAGLGRTGDYFGFEWSGIRPDVLTLAKPLAAGLPLGSVLFTQAVSDRFPAGAHGTTFGGGPLACRIALEFLSIMGDLLPHIREVGSYLQQRLYALKARHSVIRCIRGRGMMIGIELKASGHDFVRRALTRRLLINCTQENVLRLLPPFILTREQADEGLTILDEILAEA